MLKQAGMDRYRFSISWPRILPDGTNKTISHYGLQYYNNLIDELLDNDIEPMVTIFHWDMPVQLERYGGMLNSSIIDRFEDYADVLFKNFGDRVKLWITFNEPFITCEFGYGSSFFPPLVNKPGVGNYLCNHNILLANARIYELYQRKYKAKYNGKIGITLVCSYSYPKDPMNIKDVEAAERAMQFMVFYFLFFFFVFQLKLIYLVWSI